MPEGYYFFFSSFWPWKHPWLKLRTIPKCWRIIVSGSSLPTMAKRELVDKYPNFLALSYGQLGACLKCLLGFPSGTMPLSQYMLTLPMWAYLPSPPLFHSQLELGLLHQSLLLERKLRQRCHETQPGKKLHDVLSMKFCLYGAQVTPTKCPPSYSWKTLANFSLCLKFPERDFPESEVEQTPLSRHLFPPLTPVPPLYRGCCM